MKCGEAFQTVMATDATDATDATAADTKLPDVQP